MAAVGHLLDLGDARVALLSLVGGVGRLRCEYRRARNRLVLVRTFGEFALGLRAGSDRRSRDWVRAAAIPAASRSRRVFRIGVRLAPLDREFARATAGRMANATPGRRSPGGTISRSCSDYALDLFRRLSQRSSISRSRANIAPPLGRPCSVVEADLRPSVGRPPPSGAGLNRSNAACVCRACAFLVPSSCSPSLSAWRFSWSPVEAAVAGIRPA